MKRKSRKYDVSNFIKQNPEFSDKNVEIWIDYNNGMDILSILNEKDKNGNYIRQDRFNLILREIFNFRYNEDLYEKEKISGKASNITAMKFKRHRGKNIRIYCKEFVQNGKKIVMISTTNKKTQSVNKKLKSPIESLGDYEYEF